MLLLGSLSTALGGVEGKPIAQGPLSHNLGETLLYRSPPPVMWGPSGAKQGQRSHSEKRVTEGFNNLLGQYIEDEGIFLKRWIFGVAFPLVIISKCWLSQPLLKINIMAEKPSRASHDLTVSRAMQFTAHQGGRALISNLSLEPQ